MKWELFQNNTGWWGMCQAVFSVKEMILIITLSAGTISIPILQMRTTAQIRNLSPDFRSWGLHHRAWLSSLMWIFCRSQDGWTEEDLQRSTSRESLPTVATSPHQSLNRHMLSVPLCRCHVTARGRWAYKTRQPLPSEATAGDRP